MEKKLFLLGRILTKSKAFLAMLVYTDCIGLQGVNASANALTLSQTSPGFSCLQYKSFENTAGKGEIAQAIPPFPTVFSTCLESFLPFSINLKLSSANYFSLEGSKICHLGKG